MKGAEQNDGCDVVVVVCELDIEWISWHALSLLERITVVGVSL